MRHRLPITLITVVVVLALAAPGYAAGMSGRGAAYSGHHDGAGHHDGHGHHHDGDYDHGWHYGHHGFRGPYVYWNSYPVYVPTTPSYWYYCPSAQAYYPYVTYCVDSWVPVRAE